VARGLLLRHDDAPPVARDREVSQVAGHEAHRLCRSADDAPIWIELEPLNARASRGVLRERPEASGGAVPSVTEPRKDLCGLSPFGRHQEDAFELVFEAHPPAGGGASDPDDLPV